MSQRPLFPVTVFRTVVAGLGIPLLLLFASPAPDQGQQRPSAAELLDQFQASTVFWKQFEVAKAIVGLQEFQAHQISSEIPGEEIEASKRALERAEAIVHAELKRGISGLATIGSTAPFVGLFGTVVGIINAFKGISN